MNRISLMAGAAFLAGCGEPQGVHQLTSEHQEIIDELVTRTIASQEVVKRLVQQADPLFDAQGKEGDNGQLVADIEATQETLQYFHENGKILEYDGGQAAAQRFLHGNSEASASFHETGLKDNSLEDDFIALNVVDVELWTSGMLMHEVGHENGGHKKPIHEAVENGVSDSELLTVTLNEQDYSYLLSELYVAADETAHGYIYDITDTKETLLESIASGEMTLTEAQQQADIDFTYNQEAWLDKNSAQVYENHKAEFAQLGLDAQEIRQALSAPGFQEYLQEITSEARNEVLQEIQNERSSELKGELRPPNARPIH